MKLTKKHQQLIEDYGKLICKNAEEIDDSGRFTWQALFIGFAIGRGFSIEEATDYGFYMEAFKKEALE